MPSYGSSLVTNDYMTKVRDGTLWCPKYKDIRLLPCPAPPGKAQLLHKLDVLMLTTGRSSGIDANHTPDKSWLIAVLSTLDNKDEVFSKAYVPMTRKEKAVLSNHDGFFTNLPAGVAARGRGTNLISKSSGKVDTKRRKHRLLRQIKTLKEKVKALEVPQARAAPVNESSNNMDISNDVQEVQIRSNVDGSLFRSSHAAAEE